MKKFLITPRSHNRITGPIMMTTSPRATCPSDCPFRKGAKGVAAGACYAEHGFLGGFIWTKLDRLPVGARFKSDQVQVRSLDELTAAIRALPEGALWRHNQAGDLCEPDEDEIDLEILAALVDANEGRRGFTYTHCDVVENETNRTAIAAANAAGFTINLSANSLAHADELAALEIAPVTAVVPADQRENGETPAGRPVVICPARRRDDVTCATCGICATKRTAIIAFPALGRRASTVEA